MVRHRFQYAAAALSGNNKVLGIACCDCNAVAAARSLLDRYSIAGLYCVALRAIRYGGYHLDNSGRIASQCRYVLNDLQAIIQLVATRCHGLEIPGKRASRYATTKRNLCAVEIVFHTVGVGHSLSYSAAGADEIQNRL